MSALLPHARVADELASLGLRRGDRVLVHSSFRAVGPDVGGPEEIVDALVSVVGPAGLVVMPTFTYDTGRFDPQTTPGRTGVIAETLRGRPAAVRSLHPFYSVAALGNGAAELCDGHELGAGAAVGGPLDRLAEAGGKVLLLGTGHTSNTTMHVGESRAGVGYLDIPFDPDWPTDADVDLEDGRSLHVSYDRFPGCSRAFGVIEAPLRRRGAVRDGRVGQALTQLVDGQAIVEETIALLRQDEAALLCNDPACYRCSHARARQG